MANSSGSGGSGSSGASRLDSGNAATSAGSISAVLASATRAATGDDPGLTLAVAIGLLLVGGIAIRPLRRLGDPEGLGPILSA